MMFITLQFFIRAFMIDVTFITVLDVLTLQSWSGFASLYTFLNIRMVPRYSKVTNL